MRHLKHLLAKKKKCLSFHNLILRVSQCRINDVQSLIPADWFSSIEGRTVPCAHTKSHFHFHTPDLWDHSWEGQQGIIAKWRTHLVSKLKMKNICIFIDSGFLHWEINKSVLQMRLCLEHKFPSPFMRNVYMKDCILALLFKIDFPF